MKKVFFAAIAAMTLGLLSCPNPTGGNGGKPGERLVENQWANGNIAVAEGTAEFTIAGIAGVTYYIWINQGRGPGYGDGAKTLRGVLSAFYADGSVIFDEYWGEWASPESFTPETNGTVTVRVRALENYTGTFSLVYGTENKRPPVPVVMPASATHLAENAWADGSIAAVGGEAWYSFDAAADTEYRIWTNASSGGDGSKTLAVMLSAYNTDGSEVFLGAGNLWQGPRVIKPDSAGRIWIRVNGSRSAGTFGIVYSAGNVRPALPVDLPFDDASALTENQWTDGEIAATARELWYAFDVEQGKTYRIWWNDQYGGDRSKSLEAAADAWSEDGGEIAIGRTYGFNNPITFTPTSTGTVYVRVRGSSASNTGTFAMTYSTGSARPTLPAPDFPSDAIVLAENQWTDGEITATAGELWYSFPVVAGAEYRVWWNGGYRGNGSKSLIGAVGAWYEDGSEIEGGTSDLNRPITFTPASSSTVYVRARGNYASFTGTFGIVYGMGSARPALPAPDFPSDAIVLAENQWTDGEITATVREIWYSFPVVAGTEYRVYGSQSLEAAIDAWHEDGSEIAVGRTWGFYTPITFTPTSDGAVWVRVRGTQTSIAGTFGIVYSTGDTRPAITP
ncbi:MAG: hypothetical protein FWE09_02970 [Treponema sp.]|nr:hypothetical protein [Treponema sp.]